MDQALSIMSGFGQGALTVATLSFAIILGARAIIDSAKDSRVTNDLAKTLESLEARVPKFAIAALLVVGGWTIGTAIFVLVPSNCSMWMEKTMWGVVVFQSIMTGLYSYWLMSLVYKLKVALR